MSFLFFFDPLIPGKFSGYNHCMIAIAEGLKALGCTFYGNIDFWWDNSANDYLIKKAPPEYKADVDIYTHTYFSRNNFDVSKVNTSRINVIVDQRDGLKTVALNPAYKHINIILRPHYVKNFEIYNWEVGGNTHYKLQYNDNVVPWQFGLTNRLIEHIGKYYTESPTRTILVNHRVKHSLRDMASEEFLPTLSQEFEVVRNITDALTDEKDFSDTKSYWVQTGRRHDDNYFKSINQHMLNFCFSGWITQKSVGRNPAKIAARAASKLIAKTGTKISPINYLSIVNHDTWRPWEAFIASTIPVMMDYEYWGFELPVMPVSGKHYWGVKGLDFKESAETLNEMSEKELTDIMKQGKQWALDNYAPIPTAKRFLELLQQQ